MCYLLFKLFSFCFEKHIVPSLWLKSVVRPIPKSSDKNPYVPLNYRGISLISCIGKIYSSILDNRLIAYLDENNILVDEQMVSGNLGPVKTTFLHCHLLSKIKS